MNHPRILGVIPARGGSKGIPRKNLALLSGRPLLAHTIEASKQSKLLTRTVLSSEDPEILAVGRQLGAAVSFVRPAELATDTATAGQVAVHALQAVEAQEHMQYDYVCLLEPTAPLRRPVDIDQAITHLLATGADAVVSVVRIEAPHPVKTFVVSHGRLHPFLPDQWRDGLTRQELEPVYAVNGAVYCARREIVIRSEAFWGPETVAFVMPAERSINIDTELDLKFAEFLLTREEG